MKKAKEIIKEIEGFPRFPAEERLPIIREILREIGSPELSTKFIHVVGTNGKGSTCAMLESVLRESGYKVGLFSSPHIYDWKERVQINREMIPNESLERLYPQIEPYDLGVFEAWFLLALLYFKQESVDIAILEAGIGGRLDTTNVIPSPEVAVLTNVGFDHMDLLGETLEEIAIDKAAIAKDAVLVTGVETESILAVLPPHRHVSSDGDFKDQNKALTREVIKVLQEQGWEIGDSAIERGLESAYWPLRMEVLKTEPLVIADGAHNVQGIQAFMSALSPKCSGKRVVMLGISADKDYPKMLSLLVEGMDVVILSESKYRAVPTKDLASTLPDALQIPEIDEAADWIIQNIKKTDELFILGSIYFAADMVQTLEVKGFLRSRRSQ